jgi:hypothetical protein
MRRHTFWLTVVSVNWGRGYQPGEFRRNVLNVMEHVDGREHVVILPQELDEEPDPAHEHRVFASMLDPGTRKVHWRSREPIILTPGATVLRRARVEVMPSGQDIDPRLHGVGPDRPLNMCVARIGGVALGFGNWHPHRSGLDPRVDAAREKGAGVAADALTWLSERRGGISGVYGTDYNSSRMPRMVPGERVAHHRGLDHLRYWEHPDGARLTLVAHGSLNGTIDPHDPIWARFRVESR